MANTSVPGRMSRFVTLIFLMAADSSGTAQLLTGLREAAKYLQIRARRGNPAGIIG